MSESTQARSGAPRGFTSSTMAPGADAQARGGVGVEPHEPARGRRRGPPTGGEAHAGPRRRRSAARVAAVAAASTAPARQTTP